MKKNIVTLLLGLSTYLLSAQNIDKIINANEVERIERVLSSDDMRGRRTFTPDIDKAADFISSEFKKSRLQYFNGLKSYRQEFTRKKMIPISAEGTFDGAPVNLKNIIAFQPKLILLSILTQDMRKQKLLPDQISEQRFTNIFRMIKIKITW